MGAADEPLIEEVVASIKSIVRLFQNRSPNSAIVLVGLFPRSQNSALAPAIHVINEKLAAFAKAHSIHFVNINEHLTDSNGNLLKEMSQDGLHFTEQSYQVWAEALKPIFLELLGPPAAEDLGPPATGDPRAQKN